VVIQDENPTFLRHVAKVRFLESVLGFIVLHVQNLGYTPLQNESKVQMVHRALDDYEKVKDANLVVRDDSSDYVRGGNSSGKKVRGQKTWWMNPRYVNSAVPRFTHFCTTETMCEQPATSGISRAVQSESTHI
jgi:hypothetical protein